MLLRKPLLFGVDWNWGKTGGSSSPNGKVGSFIYISKTFHLTLQILLQTITFSILSVNTAAKDGCELFAIQSNT